MAKAIKVRGTKGPRQQLCWQQPPLVGSVNPMVHCDRAIGHPGPHSWADREAAGAALLQGEQLTIRRLIEANLSRVVRWHPGGLADWTPLEWAGAMAGEVGEACNAAKKLKRITGRIKNINTEDGRSLTSVKTASHKIASECADAVIYGVLLCASVGQDIEAAIVKVFNKKSEEYGFPERLSSDAVATWHDELWSRIKDARIAAPTPPDTSEVERAADAAYANVQRWMRELMPSSERFR